MIRGIGSWKPFVTMLMFDETISTFSITKSMKVGGRPCVTSNESAKTIKASIKRCMLLKPLVTQFFNLFVHRTLSLELSYLTNSSLGMMRSACVV